MFLELRELFGFPTCAALGEDAGEQLRAGLGGRALLALRFAPVGGERAFDGGLEQGLAVLLQLLLRGLQLRHAGIEVGQKFFEFGDDAGLFGVWRER